MSNKSKTEQKGITLIALVITVIVLLILAGTAISIAINGGDIFGKASQAREGWNAAVATEQEKLNDVMSILNTVTGGNNGGGANPTPTPETLPAEWGATASTYVASAYPSSTATQKAPIPKGFKASIYPGENTIAGGLVIYQTTELTADEGNSTTNHDNAMANYNQFVWIPVTNINDMVMCTKTGTAGIDDSSKTACDVKIDPTTKKIYCATHMNLSTEAENKEATTYLCGKLHATGTGNNFGTVNTSYNENSGLREPAVVTGSGGTSYDGNINTTTNVGPHGYASATTFLNELKEQFYKMAKSVATYGGFYVGRYEAGYNGTTYTSYKGTTVADSTKTENILNAGSYNASTNPAGVGNWYGLYNALLKTETNTTSQMIWGCQYDQVMKFVNNKKDGQNGDYIVTTVSSNRHHSSGKEQTGNNTYDLVQNIYDLESNFNEWTAEANSTSGRVNRGGNCINSSSASCRNNLDPTDTNSYLSSRPGLFVNL